MPIQFTLDRLSRGFLQAIVGKYVIILIMFDLGIQELIVIFIVALLVFGPKKLPELAMSLGKAVRDIRQSMSGVKEQIDSEIREIKDPISLKNDIYKDSDLFPNEAKMNQKAEEKDKTSANQNISDKPSETPTQKVG